MSPAARTAVSRTSCVSLLPQDARLSDDPEAGESDAGKSDATPPVHPITGAFSDPHLTAEFGPTAFRRMFLLHVAGMGLMLGALVSMTVVERKHAVRFIDGLFCVTAALGLWARVAVHQLEDTKKAQSLGAHAWTIVVVVGVGIDLLAMAEDPYAYCTGLDSPVAIGGWALACAFIAFVSASHGLGFWHATSLLGLVLLALIAEAVVCHIKLSTVMSTSALIVSVSVSVSQYQVWLNDKQLRNSFFLLQKTTRENERSTERVEQLEEARGFDRELMMAMTFHEVRNPLNGTVGHLRLAKQLVDEMRGEHTGARTGARMGARTGERSFGGDAATGSAGCVGEEGARGADEGDGGRVEALAEEVGHAIAATELAVQYLSTLATLHGALTGSRKLVLAPTELTQLVRAAASVVRPQLQPGVELRVEVPPCDTHVMTDGLMLTQVLLNLMQNAARFTRTGFVCVRCRAERVPAADGSGSGSGASPSLAARYQFAVLDSGSGISEATKATLFDLYNSVGGIGLGMFLSGKLLSLLGSKIEVESPWRSEGPDGPDAPGAPGAPGGPGAAFHFSIVMGVVDPAEGPAPVAAAYEQSTSGAAPEEPPPTPTPTPIPTPPPKVGAARGTVALADVELLPSSPVRLAPPPHPEQRPATRPAAADTEEGARRFEPDLRVLVADDQLTNRRLLRCAFTKHFGKGWHVTEVATAEEALAAATSSGFALIVMDEIFASGLEAMHGSEAIRQIRAHEARSEAAWRPRAVIVSCTGNALSSLAADLRAAGADLVWGKPMPNFTNDEMQDELAPLLAASCSHRLTAEWAEGRPGSG